MDVMLKFVSVLVIVGFNLFLISTDVLGATTVTVVEPKNRYVNESKSITFSCQHTTDSNFDYTIAWRTSSSETIADVSTDDNEVSVKSEFTEYFEGSYSSKSKIFSLTLISANVSLHNQSFVCRVETTEDPPAEDSLILIIYFIRPGIIFPPVNMTDLKSAEFICDAEGQPDPTYQWKMASDDTISNLCDTNDDLYSCSGDGSILNISSVDFFKHNTNFTCLTFNEAGSEESDPTIPNKHFDFFYCVSEQISANSYDNNGLMCSGIEFTLNFQSNPENYTIDDGNSFSNIASLLTRVSVIWFQTANLPITCNNLVAARSFNYNHDNPCWTPIILIIVFACFLVVIIILVCFLCIPKQPREVIVIKVAATELTVTWIGHNGGCQCHQTFTVEYRVFGSGKAWNRAATVDEPPVTLTGLQPLTKHEIRVQCHNMLWKSKMGTVTATTGS